MSRTLTGLLGALGLFALAGCGQKGALYLPDESIQTPVEIRTSPAAAAQAETAPAATPPAAPAPAAAAAPDPATKDRERKPETAPR